MTSPAVSVVLDWHAALNAGDIARVLALSTADVEVGGPRGIGQGIDLLRDWLDRAGIRLVPGRVVEHGSTVVVEEDAEWRAPDSGEVTGSQRLASVFGVRDGRVARIIRYPDLQAALQAAGLAEPEPEKLTDG